jgi:hypothetical protein
VIAEVKALIPNADGQLLMIAAAKLAELKKAMSGGGTLSDLLAPPPAARPRPTPLRE